MSETENESTVTVSNELVRAVQRLTLNEKRLLMLGLSKLNTDMGINQLISIKAVDLASMYGMQTSNAYTALKDTKERLWEREAMIADTGIRWIITYRMQPKAGCISLRFHPDLEPHILDLKSRFTQYLLSRAAEFSHVYSWRLFELLMQFKKTGLLKIPVEEFKRILETPDAYERDFGLIRSKVINVALKEIKEKAGLPVKLNIEKEGRKVVMLNFTFPTEQQTALPIAEKPIKTPPKAQTEKTEPDTPSERQRSAEAQGIAQLEALARQHGIEIPKAKKMN
jgi:plasmid replication initiation protein